MLSFHACYHVTILVYTDMALLTTISSFKRLGKNFYRFMALFHRHFSYRKFPEKSLKPMVSVAIYWGERRWNLMKSGCYSVVGPRLKTRSETSAKFLVFPGYFCFFNYNDRVLVLSQSNACVLPWGCDTLVGNRNRRKFWIRLQPTCEFACHSVPFFVYGISLKITP